MADAVVLEMGQPAPEIDTVATGGEPFHLTDQRGRWVAIYFYPRANTPG